MRTSAPPRLSPAERALLTARRKEAYETLHPETRNGATGNGRKKLRQNGEATRLTADMAAQTGKSERAVQRDVARGSAIDPDILKELWDTKLDKGTVLDALAAISRAAQAMKVAEFRSSSTSDMPRRKPDSDGVEDTTSPTGFSPAAAWLGMGAAPCSRRQHANQGPGTGTPVEADAR